MKKIDQSWIKPLFLGSIFMGTGGGGKTNNILLLLEELFLNNTSVDLISTYDLEDNKFYASTGLIGSPEVLDDYNFSGQESIESLNLLKKMSNHEPSGLYTLECAGINVMHPLITAAILNLPLIDGDCIGRAFPEIQMTTLHINNIPLAPFCLTDTSETVNQFIIKDTFMLDLKIRQLLAKKDNMGFFACGMLKGSVLKKTLIPHTYSLTKDIGIAFINCKSYDELLNHLILITKNSIYGAAIELFRGKIIGTEDSADLRWQVLKLRGIDSYSNENFTILMQNEFLITYRNDTLSGMVPDLISLIDIDSLLPINITDIKPQMNVAVIGVPAPIALKTPSALNVVGPSTLGYKSPYKSLEELHFNYYF